MTYAQFWDRVARNLGYPQDDPDPYDDLPDLDVAVSAEPCLTCGAVSACAYDAEGRPLIHCTTEGDD